MQDNSDQDHADKQSPDAAQPQRNEKLSTGNFRELTGQIVEITRAGLPLAEGLRALAAEASRGRTRRGLSHIASQLESGVDLETALQSQGAPLSLRALLRTGAKLNCTEAVMQEYLSHAESAATVRRQIQMSLAYPLLTSLFALGTLLFLLTYVVPQFTVIFRDFGTELPGITEIVVGLSQFWVNSGMELLVATVIGVPLLWLLANQLISRPVQRRWLCAIPLIGPVLRWSAMARFSHLLAVLIAHRSPLPDALKLAGDGADDADLREASHQLAAAAESGQPIVLAARQSGRFPAFFTQALTWKDQSEALPTALHGVGDILQQEAAVQASLISQIVAPLTIAFALGFISFVVMALFMPLIKLLNDLS